MVSAAISPFTVLQSVQIEIFGDYQTAWARFDRLRRRKRGTKTRVVGVVPLKDEGRTTKVYCNGYEPKNLLHDVHVTHALVPFIRRGVTIKRGFQCDRDLKPDATVEVGESGHGCIREE